MKSGASKGFTLVELMVAVALFSIISTLLLVNLSRPKAFADISSSENLIYVTLKEAQNLAASGQETSGVHFDRGKFVLFDGSSYNPSSSTNLVTTLDPSLSIESINAPGGNVLFSRLSGETSGGSFILKSASGETKTFTINRFGAVNVN